MVACGFSHTNNDDPIVFPGEAGGVAQSHLHRQPRRGCGDDAGVAARRGVKLPRCRRRVCLLGSHALLRKPGFQAARRRRLLRAPDARARPGVPARSEDDRRQRERASSPVAGVRRLELRRDRRPASIGLVPTCPSDRALHLRATFPSCWNGRDLDSVDHKSHLAYAVGETCPRSHPVALPSLVLIFLYSSADLVRPFQAAGRFGAHADFVNGWDQETLEALVATLN